MWITVVGKIKVYVHSSNGTVRAHMNKDSDPVKDDKGNSLYIVFDDGGKPIAGFYGYPVPV